MHPRYSGSFVLFLLVAAFSYTSALAQDAVTRLGQFQDWTAYIAGKDASRICYAVGEATSPAPGRANRLAYVSHRPSKKAWSVVMIYPGILYQSASEATVEIGKSRFQLFTHKNAAWADDADADARLVKAMRVGKSMTVHGIDSTGVPIADQYSLAGFLAAYRRIGEACNVK